MTIEVKKIDNFYKMANLAFKRKPLNMTALEFAMYYQINQKYHNQELAQETVTPDAVINEDTLLIMLEYINLLSIKDNKIIANNLVIEDKELINLLAQNHDNSLNIALQKTDNIYDLVNKLAEFKKNGLFNVAYNFSSQEFSVTPRELTKKLLKQQKNN